MPLMDGIEATRVVLRTVADPPKILVVTTFENDEYVYEALRAGADGFLLKRARPAEIVHAVRLVAEGESLLFPAAVRQLAANYGTSKARDAMERAALTDREAAVLRLMARGRSDAEIAAELVVGVETVKTHVSAVLAKLGARDRTQAVIAAYESGFVAPRRPRPLTGNGPDRAALRSVITAWPRLPATPKAVPDLGCPPLRNRILT